MAFDLANTRLAIEREGLELARADLEADRAEAAELGDKLAGDVEQLQSRLAAIEAAELAVRNDTDEPRGQLAAAQAQVHSAEACAQEIGCRASVLRTELDHAHQDAAHVRAERDKAQQQAAHERRPGGGPARRAGGREQPGNRDQAPRRRVACRPGAGQRANQATRQDAGRARLAEQHKATGVATGQLDQVRGELAKVKA